MAASIPGLFRVSKRGLMEIAAPPFTVPFI